VALRFLPFVVVMVAMVVVLAATFEQPIVKVIVGQGGCGRLWHTRVERRRHRTWLTVRECARVALARNRLGHGRGFRDDRMLGFVAG
jgi:hypothetical protein